MKFTTASIKGHPVLTYYVLAFAISWGAILAVVAVGPGAILPTGEQYETVLPFVALAMLAGPSMAGIVLTGLLSGRTGFREMRSRLTRWRVGARWYAVALLTGPLSLAAVLLALSLRSPEFLPGMFASSERFTLVRGNHRTW